MDYKIINRPKLPRNKFGQVEDRTSVGGGTSYFSTSANPDGSTGSAYIPVFVGSTNSEDGKEGLVPKPRTNNDEPLIDNDNMKFLKGNGGWTDIPVSRYTSENVNKDGIDLTGNLNVSDTITTQTLNVTGTAHFWELVIDKVRAAGGNLLITPGNFKVDYVGSDVNYNVDPTQSPFNLMFYNSQTGTGILGLQELFTNQNVTQLKAKRLYMKNTDGDSIISSEVQLCDMVRCKTFNLLSQDSDNDYEISNKDYWTFVLGTGLETYNDETCMYIDVLYKYTANGNTYGIGTTITYQEETVNTHLTYYENDYTSNVTGQDKVIIVTTEQSNMFYAYFDGNHHGNVSWDGTKWNFDERGNSLSLNGSFTYSDGGELGICECVMDRRWANPVLKMRNLEGHYVNNLFYGMGFFYAEDYIEDSGSSNEPLLDSFTFGYGTFEPGVGDELVTLGNLLNDQRQNAILISSYDPMDSELKAPAIAQYEGINQFTSLSPFRTSSIASNGNTFLGKFMVNYEGVYMDIDQKLNLFVRDLNTGLEAVGIHLDGDNSTIKMIGSVEIKQNGDGTVDTLTVWDSDSIMRVKISPEAIPNKSNIQTDINPTTTVNFRTLTGQYFPTAGTTHETHHYKNWGIFTTNHRWEYWLENAYYSYITSYDIGTFNVGDKISLSGLKGSILSKAYFKGQDYVSTRSDGSHSQSISSVILRLERLNGSVWTTVTSYNLSNTAAITVSSESASISYTGSIASNYTISTAGSYRLKLEVVYNVYANIEYSSEQSDYYFSFENSFTSSIILTQPSGSMTRIGRNGLAFNTDSTGQYFYAGNDGLEMKWGDASITLDSTYGLKTNGIIQSITNNTTKYIASSTTIADCDTLNTATTVYLPLASSYGVGRVLTVIGNDYVTISTYSNSEYIYVTSDPTPWTENNPTKQTTCFTGVNTYDMFVNEQKTEENEGITTIKYRIVHRPLVRLMSSGSGWYLL